MTSEELLQSVGSVVAAHIGTMILFMLAPIVASLILDGIVAVLRNKGLRPLLVAVGLTTGFAVIGLVVRGLGVDGIAQSPTAAVDIVGLQRNASLYLVISVPLGLLGFVVRMSRLLSSRR